jgi:hypothetical protein
MFANTIDFRNVSTATRLRNLQRKVATPLRQKKDRPQRSQQRLPSIARQSSIQRLPLSNGLGIRQLSLVLTFHFLASGSQTLTVTCFGLLQPSRNLTSLKVTRFLAFLSLTKREIPLESRI